MISSSRPPGHLIRACFVSSARPLNYELYDEQAENEVQHAGKRGKRWIGAHFSCASVEFGMQAVQGENQNLLLGLIFIWNAMAVGCAVLVSLPTQNAFQKLVFLGDSQLSAPRGNFGGSKSPAVNNFPFQCLRIFKNKIDATLSSVKSPISQTRMGQWCEILHHVLWSGYCGSYCLFS